MTFFCSTLFALFRLKISANEQYQIFLFLLLLLNILGLSIKCGIDWTKKIGVNCQLILICSETRRCSFPSLIPFNKNRAIHLLRFVLVICTIADPFSIYSTLFELAYPIVLCHRLALLQLSVDRLNAMVSFDKLRIA